MTQTTSKIHADCIPDSAARIGIDSDGNRHFVGNRPIDNNIYVETPSGDSYQHPIEVIDGGFDGWIEHVEKTVGWQRKLYEVGLVEQLAEAFK